MSVYNLLNHKETKNEVNTKLLIGEKEIHSIEELKENFEVNAVLAAINDGSLERFLKSRFYEREAKVVSKLQLDDKECLKKLCETLGVDFLKFSVIVTPEVEKRLAEIKQFTDDEDVLNNFQKVAFNQEELAQLLSKDEKIIYLCHNNFSIPLSKTGVKYIGVDNPTINNPYTKEQYEKAGISIENIVLPFKVSDEIAEEAKNIAIKNGYDDYGENNSPLASYFHNQLKTAIPFYNIHLPYSTSAASKRFKSKFTAQKELTELIKKPYDKAVNYITPGNSCCVAKTLSEQYAERIKANFDPIAEQLKQLYSVKGKSNEYDKLQSLVSGAKKALYQAFETELSESSDYYGMYKFDYFVESVDIEKNDYSYEEGVFKILERLIGDSVDYTYCGLFDTFMEIEKDLNYRIATFYKSAHREYITYLRKIEEKIELIGNDLPNFKENETIGDYITRITVSDKNFQL